MQSKSRSRRHGRCVRQGRHPTNNAGVSGAARNDAPDKWQKVIDINLTALFLFAQAAGREMLA